MEISYVEEIKRKLIHLSSLWMVAATLLLAQKQWIVCLIFAVLLLLTLVFLFISLCGIIFALRSQMREIPIFNKCTLLKNK